MKMILLPLLWAACAALVVALATVVGATLGGILPAFSGACYTIMLVCLAWLLAHLTDTVESR